jgi:hypothetical protein
VIISASRRTDIPAFYGEWMLNRLRAGEVLVRNPVNRTRVQRVPLSPHGVDCIVFWTKDPGPFLPRLPEIDRMGYRYYFLFTLTPYGGDIEANVGRKSSILESFKRLSGTIGPDRVVWRYDPVLITSAYTLDYHREWFARLAESLDGHTRRCVISFVQMYRKIRGSMAAVGAASPDDGTVQEIARSFGAAARSHSMELLTCSTGMDLAEHGIGHSACIDAALITRITGRAVPPRKDAAQRPECGCAESRDIGSYDTCPHGCLYCYANSNVGTAARARALCDPGSPLLCDALHGDETVTEHVPRGGGRPRSADQLPFIP